jgi:3-oxoacyl-[acyl-carrier protein] reductase
MDLNIKGKRALVLASSRGIGLAIAQAIAAEGASVIIVGRNEDRLAAAATAINGRGAGKARAIRADLAKPGDVDALIAAVEGESGVVDIVVNNTGGPPAKTAVAI